MSDPLTVTAEVTQDCIQQATLTPRNCPVARAIRAHGLKDVHVGHTAVTATGPDGRTMTAAVSPALAQVIHRFDRGAVVPTGNYPLCFRRTGTARTDAQQDQAA